MTDTTIVAAFAKTTFSDLAKQSFALALGLQNAAAAVGRLPGETTPNQSIQYLFAIADNLAKLATECNQYIKK